MTRQKKLLDWIKRIAVYDSLFQVAAIVILTLVGLIALLGHE